MPDLLRLWFGTSLTVNQRRYLWSGLALMALKFAGDDALVHVATGQSWTPLDYISPLISQRQELTKGSPWLAVALGTWTLPFLWIGSSMTLRRLLDARSAPLGWGCTCCS